MAPRAMVLCAGLGTRLRPLTLELPKPLVPVGDRPLLAHIASRLSAAGFAELVINTHHLPESFSRLEQDLGLKAQVVHEPRIMGTAGGVYGARALFGRPPIVLWNGDIWVEPDLPGLCARAESGGLVLGVVPRPRGQGTVGLTAAGDVARLRGEVFGEEISGADYVGWPLSALAASTACPERAV
ncbi:MAG: NTP transferase domain-containing protein [Myxococcales bacterium]|nr:NTP transferase domain-containing protein [Myxococcales bacterium]